MNSRGGNQKAAAGAIALALMLAPGALRAQSAGDWRLPGATVKPATGAQGPVDRDNPVVTTTVRPSASATPTPSPAPAASPSAAASQAAASGTGTTAASPRTTSSAARPQPVRVPAAAASGAASAPATTTTAATALPQADDASALALPTLTPPAAPVPSPSVAAEAPVAAAPGWYWPWVAGGLALLAALLGLLLWRRREPKVPRIAFERPQVPEPAQTPSAEPAVQPLAAVAPPAPAVAEPQIAVALTPGLGITLEARRMSASLMATTLNYVLTLKNTGAEPLSALAVEGDMVSAHASLPPEAQIANDNQRLELRHALVQLAPGESAEFTGDFRLPLASVTPIRAGEAAYFVPLARLRVEANTPAGQSLVQVLTYVVGELAEAPGSSLRPFRLDLGPRVYSRLGQRAVN
ncbi:MAG TPA: hypothetical protein PK680_04955 [Novosphingobium sp.]|nr:hypothetical protein [Novosphingobium sp.]HQA17716.1 hypothetical protein [Novosphingobium sp.]